MQLDIDSLAKEALADPQPVDTVEVLKTAAIAQHLKRANRHRPPVTVQPIRPHDAAMEITTAQVDILEGIPADTYIHQTWPELLRLHGHEVPDLTQEETLGRNMLLHVICRIGTQLQINRQALRRLTLEAGTYAKEHREEFGFEKVFEAVKGIIAGYVFEKVRTLFIAKKLICNRRYERPLNDEQFVSQIYLSTIDVANRIIKILVENDKDTREGTMDW